MAHDAVVTWASDRGAGGAAADVGAVQLRRAVENMLAEREADARRIAVAGWRRTRAHRARQRAAPRRSKQSPARSTLSSRQSRARRERFARPGVSARAGKPRSRRKRAVRDAASVWRPNATQRSRRSRGRAPTIRSRGVEQSGRVFERAYLVDDDAYDDFRAALTGLSSCAAPSGVRYEFTGPWPPYHFVRGLD